MDCHVLEDSIEAGIHEDPLVITGISTSAQI